MKCWLGVNLHKWYLRLVEEVHHTLNDSLKLTEFQQEEHQRCGKEQTSFGEVYC